MKEPPVPTPEELHALGARLGSEAVRRRLLLESRIWEFKHRPAPLLLKPWGGKDGFIEACLSIAGLRRAARAQFLNVQVRENVVRLPALPRAFDGLRLLQIADPHPDLDPDIIDSIERVLEGLSWDVALLTGDYHDHLARPHEISLRAMERLVPRLGTPCFGTMGNHDLLVRAIDLERLGVRMLLNESEPLERDGARLWLCGVDDPRYFQTHDLARAARRIPNGECSVLLAHSPQVYREAAAAGFSLLLAGHTHGGQLCLPGGIPIYRNARVPGRVFAGAWREGNMAGYTSRGTGACGVAARLFCPPEVTIHRLVRSV